MIKLENDERREVKKSNVLTQEKFPIIKLEDINVVILVCDLTSKKSFSKIKDKWYKKVKSNFTNAYMVIAENKSDLYNQNLKEKMLNFLE